MTTARHDRRRFRRRIRRCTALLAAAALVGASCGNDDDATPTPPVDEARVGGEITILLHNEIAHVDGGRSTGAGAADALRMFPIYGALVGFSVELNEVLPILAESLEPGPDGREWTLVLREGIRFSDGTTFDAEAVQANWERVQDPATGSPAFTLAESISEMEVVDERRLRIVLSVPNSHFDKAMSRSALNYIASAEAIRTGHDLGSDPIGAGPYLLERWDRDDRFVLVRNPDWIFAPQPYLDRITYRIVLDREQRADTLDSGDADAAYLDGSAAALRTAQAIGGEFLGIAWSSSPALSFNTTIPPMDDVRVRRAVAHAIDRDVLTEIVHGSQFRGAHNFAQPGSPWNLPEGELPGYDPAAAQALVDEVVAETGQPIVIELMGFVGSAGDPERMRFVQTSLNQLDDVEATLDLVDAGTGYGRVLGFDYQVASWGYPFQDPEPGLWNAVHSAQSTNYSGYSHPEVDRLMEQGRVTRDLEERVALYRQVFTHLAEDLPFLPTTHAEFGFVVAPHLRGADFYEDVLRLDLLWLDR